MHCPAHPRSRGENAYQSRARDIFKGSSPLTRGKLNRRRHGQGGHGLIPAHAGKTQSSSAWSGRAWAHPRSRGENHVARGRPIHREGSSPLTRGKPPPGSPRPHLPGLIPAHAGKTSRMSVAACSAQAHPRSRGENGYLPLSGHQEHGSSPLTRGKHIDVVHGRGGRGLIPAHAGKTCCGG